MIDLACPNCGRSGSVPRDKINSRLVCKKCHMVFHMNAAGRAVLGEPRVDPSKSGVGKAGRSGLFKALEEAPIALPKLSDLGELRENLSARALPIKPVLIGLVGIALCWGVFSFAFAPPESIADRATAVVQAFVNDDLAYLKKNAMTDSVDDVVRWFDGTHSQLVQARQGWKGGTPTVQVTVIDEDRKQRTGEVEAFIVPPGLAARNVSVESAGTPAKPVGLHLKFGLEGNRWRLNGKSMSSAVPAASPSPDALTGP